MSSVFIIAEAGVNHNGDLHLAHRLIECAAWAGADAVKFQCFQADQLACAHAPKADYQQQTTGTDESQREMLRRLELGQAEHRELMSHARERGLVFISSPFDLKSIDLLTALDLECLKIPSGEITNLPYLRRIGAAGRRLLLSTGMSRMDEIEQAVDILERAGTQRQDITLLHCNSEYPTPFEDVNLRAMNAMRAAFPSMAVGYSDHTPGIEAAIAAVALGAAVIEKHFTVNRALPGPDHRASLEPDQLKDMVAAIRHIELALGDGVKRPSPSESRNRDIARKSIVAARAIQAGEPFTESNLATKRPGTGTSPLEWDNIVGTRATKNYETDDAVAPENREGDAALS